MNSLALMAEGRNLALAHEGIAGYQALAGLPIPSPGAQLTSDPEMLQGTANVTVREGVARLPIRGILLPRVPWRMRFGWATSLEQAIEEFGQAIRSPQVRAVVLDVSTPGGDIEGVAELAELVYKARAFKPIVAYISGFGASGGYWIASAASRRVIAGTGIAGSIGTILRFRDFSAMEQKAGIKTIEIISSQSPRKAMNPATEAGRSEIQVILDRLADVFINTVARNVGVSRAKVLADFGRGGLFVGADAVTAGLAHQVMTYEALHAELCGRRPAALLTVSPSTAAPIAATASPPRLAPAPVAPVVTQAERDKATAARVLAVHRRVQQVKDATPSPTTPAPPATGDDAVAARVLATHERLNPGSTERESTRARFRALLASRDAGAEEARRREDRLHRRTPSA